MIHRNFKGHMMSNDSHLSFIEVTHENVFDQSFQVLFNLISCSPISITASISFTGFQINAQISLVLIVTDNLSEPDSGWSN